MSAWDWTCPRCGERIVGVPKGPHVDKHRRDSICEVGDNCLRRGEVLLPDGRMCCYRCFGARTTAKGYGQRETPAARARERERYRRRKAKLQAAANEGRARA